MVDVDIEKEILRLENWQKKIIKEFNGKLPKNIEQLKTLPGIGDYTSSAIMAIAFNKQFIPLDGNVERILKRVFYFDFLFLYRAYFLMI